MSCDRKTVHSQTSLARRQIIEYTVLFYSATERAITFLFSPQFRYRILRRVGLPGDS